jgi:RHS repeat-associated protein
VGTGNTSTPNTEYGIAGRKYYELNNHLGNVVTTISDKRLQPATNITPLLLPDVITAQDYYPFGMLQPGRQYTAGVNYRYGFNGKENDNEVKGTGNEQDYGMRIYDPRGGRFLSVDPITSSYPMLTPYQFASNRPIDGTDIDGKEYGTIHVDLYPKGGGTSDRYYTPYDYGQRNTYGPQGPGVNYDIVVHMQSANGYIKVYDDGPIFLPRTATQYGLPTDYGNYYGGTTLFRVLKTGIIDYGNATKPSYTAQPVDAVDYGAMLHDKGYDLLHAVGANSLFNDWGTTPVDERALSGWLAIIRNFKVGDKDPYLIEQTITKAEMGAADRGATLFQLIINSKKSKISDFVKKNVSGARSGGSHNDTEYNYQLFLKTYIGKDAKGNYIRIEKMWKKDEKGNYIPKPSGN